MIKSTTYFTAECDSCRVSFRGDTSAPPELPELEEALRKAGWLSAADGKVLCLDCVNRAAQAYAAMPVDLIVTQARKNGIKVACVHDFEEIGGSSGPDFTEKFERCRRCGYEQTTETPR